MIVIVVVAKHDIALERNLSMNHKELVSGLKELIPDGKEVGAARVIHLVLGTPQSLKSVVHQGLLCRSLILEKHVYLPLNLREHLVCHPLPDGGLVDLLVKIPLGLHKSRETLVGLNERLAGGAAVLNCEAVSQRIGHRVCGKKGPAAAFKFTGSALYGANEVTVLVPEVIEGLVGGFVESREEDDTEVLMVLHNGLQSSASHKHAARTVILRLLAEALEKGEEKIRQNPGQI